MRKLKSNIMLTISLYQHLKFESLNSILNFSTAFYYIEFECLGDIQEETSKGSAIFKSKVMRMIKTGTTTELGL
jgi:hypothetical protein